MFTCFTIFKTKSFNVEGVVLKLAFVVVRPPMPCWHEELHSLHVEKWLNDEVFPSCDLESTSDIIH